MDPALRFNISPYACLSNNPIIMIDPNGDDDYFNADGSYSHSTKEGTSIKIIVTKNVSVDLSQLDMKKPEQMRAAVQVIKYYASQVGIKGSVGVSPNSSNKKGALAHTKEDVIAINAKEGIHPVLNDFNNLKNTLVHEEDHVDKGHGFNKSSNLEHAGVYLTQMNDPSFNKTTDEFKKGIAGSSANYLRDAAMDAMQLDGNLEPVMNMVSEFNKKSDITGFSFSLVMTQNGYSNPDAYKFEVYVSPVTKTQPGK